MGSKLVAIKALIIGMHRVACPNPQFKGAISIFFFIPIPNPFLWKGVLINFNPARV